MANIGKIKQVIGAVLVSTRGGSIQLRTSSMAFRSLLLWVDGYGQEDRERGSGPAVAGRQDGSPVAPNDPE